MTSLQQGASAWVVAGDMHSGELSHLKFWVDTFGSRPISENRDHDVDDAVHKPSLRGKISPVGDC